MHGFENRLDKPCRLELDGGDLFHGTTNFVGCVHRIAWATAHSAGPDEGLGQLFAAFGPHLTYEGCALKVPPNGGPRS